MLPPRWPQIRHAISLVAETSCFISAVCCCAMVIDPKLFGDCAGGTPYPERQCYHLYIDGEPALLNEIIRMLTARPLDGRLVPYQVPQLRHYRLLVVRSC